MFTMDIGIDLGTANILIFIKGKGIVLREPAVVAVDRDSNRVLAVGEEARNMIGRTPGNIVAIRPLRDGVIANFDITEAMIRYFIEKIVGKSFVFRPRIMICIPSGVTMVEQRAVQEAAEQAGARKTYLIEEPLAAALGVLDLIFLTPMDLWLWILEAELPTSLLSALVALCSAIACVLPVTSLMRLLLIM